VTTDEEWKNFVRAIEHPKWTEAKKYATAKDRLHYSDELDKLVEAWTLKYPPEAVEELLQQAGVGAGTVVNAQDMDEDPQMNYYHFYREIEHDYVGKLRFYHPAPIVLSKQPTDVARAVYLGEHTDTICKDILGMSQAEVDTLRQKGVFQ
jgi:benzylsuccinate CoA-transferase BbsF subunit